MKVTVNGEPKEFPEERTVSILLTESNVEMPEYVSVQVNDEIIPRDSFETLIIKDGDAVDFLYYMGGGSGDFGA